MGVGNVAVDVARLDAAVPARDARGARGGLVREDARAVVHVDPRLEQHAQRRVALAVRPHDVLVAAGGVYARLVETQLRGEGGES